MTARCKFVVESVTHHAYGHRDVKLATHYDKDGVPEDASFAIHTPSGQMTVTITNPKVFDVFTPGRKVYVDVIPIEE